uniref:LSDAT_euk domain-containing protein n=1 Tax=Macrostomum lignano TaxID=282301 RepID=A0A1I8F5W1_9PLAT
MLSKAAAAAAVTDITDASADTLSRTARLPSAGQWTVARRRLELTPTECCASRTSNSSAWPERQPELIVSVTGGAKKMRPMSDKIIKSCARVLSIIATKTKTWIVTGGFNLGTNKLVRRSDSRLPTGWRSERRRCAHPASVPWGSVRDKECLLVSEDKGQAVLEPHHTQLRCCATTAPSPCSAAEIDFRPASEKKVVLRQMVRRRSRGDGSDLRSVSARPRRPQADVQAALVSVETGSPVVVVKGSGRAANVIAYICENTELERYEIEAITEEHFSSEFEPNSSEMRSLVDWLMKAGRADYQRMLNAKWEQLTGRDLEFTACCGLWRHSVRHHDGVRVSSLFDHAESTLATLLTWRRWRPLQLEPLSSWLMTESKTVGYATHNESQTAYQERLLRAVGLVACRPSLAGVLDAQSVRRRRDRRLLPS